MKGLQFNHERLHNWYFGIIEHILKQGQLWDILYREINRGRKSLITCGSLDWTPHQFKWVLVILMCIVSTCLRSVFSLPCHQKVTQMYSFSTRRYWFFWGGGINPRWAQIIFEAGVYSHSHLQCSTLDAFCCTVIWAGGCAGMLCQLKALVFSLGPLKAHAPTHTHQPTWTYSLMHPQTLKHTHTEINVKDFPIWMLKHYICRLKPHFPLCLLSSGIFCWLAPLFLLSS